MLIRNVGGAGARTTGNGILVVDARGTTDPDAFRLAAPAVAGPFEYFLRRGSQDGSAPESWFLHNTTLPPDGAEPGPGPPLPPGPPGTPVFRAEASLYAAIPAMLLTLGHTLIGTLHERVGEEEQLRGRADLDQRAFVNGAWGRLIGQHTDREGDDDGIYGHGPSYDVDLFGVQAGLDLYRYETDGGHRDHAGLSAAFGTGEGEVEHFNGSSAGTDRFDAYSVGAYWTHFGPRGWYLDGVFQATWYDVTGDSRRLPDLETSGWGFATSLEGGYPFHFGEGWLLEPQLQLVYDTIDLDTVSEAVATVRFRDVESLAGRAGVRLAKSWVLDDAPNPRRSVSVWFRPSYWHEFRGDPTTEFSSATRFVPFQADLGGGWVDLNGGATAQVTRTISLYANVSYQIGVDDSSYAYAGQAGLRVNW
jgi:outer membrane autotransporter protein